MRRDSCVGALMGLLFVYFLGGCRAEDGAVDSAPPASAEEERLPSQPIDLVSFQQSRADGERYGYRDSAGQVVIEPRFLIGLEFSEFGLAAIVDESGWAYIDVQGRIVIRPFLFDNGPDNFSEGLARFEKDGRFGFFDQWGRVAIEPRFDFARPFSEGLAAVCAGCRKESAGEHWSMQGGKWGYIEKSGKVAIPLGWDEATSFEGGRARVVEAGESIVIARDGSRQE